MQSIPLTRARADDLRRKFTAFKQHPDVPQGLRDEISFVSRMLTVRGDRATLAIPDAQTTIALQAFVDVYPFPELARVLGV